MIVKMTTVISTVPASEFLSASKVSLMKCAITIIRPKSPMTASADQYTVSGLGYSTPIRNFLSTKKAAKKPVFFSSTAAIGL